MNERIALPDSSLSSSITDECTESNEFVLELQHVFCIHLNVILSKFLFNTLCEFTVSPQKYLVRFFSGKHSFISCVALAPLTTNRDKLSNALT